ncbi:universal stress protein [Nocardioides sp. AN3]
MEPTHHRIVVGYDGSPDADLALQWAASMSRQRGLAVETVIVVNETDLLLGRHQERADREAAAWRELAVTVLRSCDLDDAGITIRHGSTVPALLAASHRAEMLVVGSRGHGLLTGSLTGSVSQHVARHATCPVVVVRRSQRPRSRHIVVGMDGSAESGRALRFACELASGEKQAVIALHALPAVTAPLSPDDDFFAPEDEIRMKHAERLLGDWAAQAVRDHPDVDISTEVVASSPVRALLDSSAAASMVAVGSRGRDAFADLLLGSVSQRVLHDALCPVAVVR